MRRCCGGSDVVELGLSPTRWHCVHAIQAEELLLGFLPLKNSILNPSGCPCFPPALLGATGWECCCEYQQPEPSPTVHSALPLPLSQKKKKKLSKINAGKREVRWELLLAAVAKNGCRAAGMSCGSVEEPSPGSPCPVRAKAAQGAVLGACQAYGAAAGETSQPEIAAGHGGWLLSSWGKNSSFTTQWQSCCCPGHVQWWRVTFLTSSHS